MGDFLPKQLGLGQTGELRRTRNVSRETSSLGQTGSSRASLSRPRLSTHFASTSLAPDVQGIQEWRYQLARKSASTGQVERAPWIHKGGSIGSANGWISQSRPVIEPVKRSNDKLSEHHLPTGRKRTCFTWNFTAQQSRWRLCSSRRRPGTTFSSATELVEMFPSPSTGRIIQAWQKVRIHVSSEIFRLDRPGNLINFSNEPNQSLHMILSLLRCSLRQPQGPRLNRSELRPVSSGEPVDQLTRSVTSKRERADVSRETSALARNGTTRA